jgi:hypothetical protein
MDINVLPSECSGHEQHSDVDSKKKSNPISNPNEPGTIANDTEDSRRAPPARYVSFSSF